MERYVCIHGHFYQPPRENPWLEEVEMQDSAYPFHDWNMKVTAECYRQNAESRILSPDRKIIDIVNNYSSISFDFGPTLLSWLEVHMPDIYESILQADKDSQKSFGGHGSAIAQAYNHIIMPLANTRDKVTQVVWGIRDFEQRFGRKPEGMWLPETAADLETLDIMAEHGIAFTLLAPRQAKQVRKIGDKKWTQVSEDNLDTQMPYVCNLPSGRKITLFLYDGAIAHDVAYGGLLNNGLDFASRLMDSFRTDGRPSALAHIATDGESFGHHHRYADMALAYCLHTIRSEKPANVTIYGQYLEKYAPTHEVEIHENSSWSCVHGVERWKSNCGCAADQSRSGRQQWREPLRKAMDQLRDKLAEAYEKNLAQFCEDPWKVRNDYIAVINDRSEKNIDSFITKAAGRELSYEEKVRFLKLTEMQRMEMLMYTSCGWFFDMMSGIETVQVMEYADRAIQLHEEITGTKLHTEFVEILAEAPAETGDSKNGGDIHKAYVERARVDLHRVGAHFAIISLFSESPDTEQVYCYTATMSHYRRLKAGGQTLATGKVRIVSNVVLERYLVDFAALHLGGYSLIAALGPPMSEDDFARLQQDLESAFFRGDTNEVINHAGRKFGGYTYSLWHLFKDEQRRLLDELLAEQWDEIERAYRHIFKENYQLMVMMRGMNIALPKALTTPAEFILNEDLSDVIEAEQIDIDALKEHTEEAKRLSLQLDQKTLRFAASRKVNSLMETLEQSADDIALLSTIESALTILNTIVPDMDLQAAQNVIFKTAKMKYGEKKRRAEGGDADATKWVNLFEKVAAHLDLVVS